MSSLSGTLLISCQGDNCNTIIKKAKKTPKVVSVFRPREKLNEVDIVITVKGSKNDIMNVKQDVFNQEGVKSIKYRITE